MRREPITGDPRYLEARGLAKSIGKLASTWRSAWTPRVVPEILSWVEGGGVILPSAVAARGQGGRLSFHSRPYWRIVLRWFTTEGVQVITVVVASQCGKTTLQIAIALFGAEFLSGPGLFLMPSEEHAEDVVRDRLRPIFVASPFGKGLKANSLRLGGVSFPGGGSLNVIGVGSPNALKGRPARWVLFDEYDEAGRYSKGAGSPLERAKTRTRTYSSLSRVVVTSTPTVESDGIWPLYEAGKRHEWQCPCPHCGEYQALEMSQIWWPRNEAGDASASPDRIESDELARYECIRCGGMWTDSQKMRAVADGRIKDLCPNEPLVNPSIHISVLYSPDVSLSKIGAHFLRCLHDPEAMIQFRNEWLAEPRREIIKTTSTDQAHLATLGLAGHEQPAQDWWKSDEAPLSPEWVRAITWGFDVQGAEVWGICRGWGDHGESVVLWAGKFSGDDDIENAALAFRREWMLPTGELLQPRRGMMDSGYRTHEVYRACASTPGLIPSKGRQDGTLPMSMSQVDRQDANRRTAGRTDLAILWTTYWQDIVSAALEAGPGRGRGVCHLPMNPPAYLYRHLLAERKVQVKGRNGQVTYIWRAHDKQNHLRDCLVYSTAAAGHAKLLDLRPSRGGIAIPEPSAEPVQTQPIPAQPAPARKESALSRMLKARAGNAGSIQMKKI